MLIRSQDKSCIVKMDGVVIQTMRKEVVCYATSDIESNSHISLGYYSTEEKSLKVLDMIEEAYAEAEFAKGTAAELAKALREVPNTKENKKVAEIARKAFAESMYFQMPADNEVEV